MARALASMTVAALVAACSGSAATPSDAPLGQADFAPGEIVRPGDPGPPCTSASLAVHKDERGFVDRLHASVEALNQDSAFLVDTGSERTYAVTTSWGPTSTSAVIGCRETTVPVVSRDSVATAPDGRPQRGMLGADLLEHDAVLDLDLRAGTLTWTGATPPVPASAIVVPIEWRDGWLIATGVRVQGRELRLILDTGSPHVFLMGTAPRDGEVRVDDTDGTGAPVTYWVADGDVALPGRAARRVPVDRADSFPTLEGLIARLGGGIDGLLGLSALGDRHIVISKRALVVDVQPDDEAGASASQRGSAGVVTMRWLGARSTTP